MRKTVRGVGREPSHKERGFSPKMSQPKGSFGTARLGTGSQPGAGSLPMRHGGPGDHAQDIGRAGLADAAEALALTST